MAMSIRNYEDDLENDIEDFAEAEPVIPEASPSTRLSRRRKIEDLFDDKRLEEELREFF